MAKAKKKEALTPEERLQAALVPDWEQPYKVPQNWCWAYLTKGAAECLDSFRKPINASERANREGDIPYYGATGQVGWIDNFLTNEQLVLVGEDGAPFLDLIKDKAYIIEGKAWVNNHAHILRSRFGSTGNSFLMHYLNIFNYHGFVNGTTRLKLTQGSMDIMPVPIPPLPEQQRIVDRIESLFAKLDEAKQKAQDALDSFETRKAAILHKAFTGELTAQWRKEHDVGMESWAKKRFDEVATIKSNLVDPATFPDFPHIAPDNIEKKTGVLLEYHTVSEDGVTSGKHRFYPGQILYSKIRPYLSKVVVVDFDGLCSADMYPIEAKGNTKCLWYYMLSEEFLEQASTAGSRSVLPKINQKELSALTVVLPTLSDEQTEIVRILDDLLAKEQQAKEAAEAVLEQIDLMKKSILARAFRGELGTNDPAEESAVELVKDIIS
ncbi:MAG: restriction endonuclease subunit S [Acutalibacteraceae bacterium]